MGLGSKTTSRTVFDSNNNLEREHSQEEQTNMNSSTGFGEKSGCCWKCFYNLMKETGRGNSFDVWL